jgi:hypothetical protein
MIFPMYPRAKFSPSRCTYGNPETLNNRKHRYAILWKDGIQRLLPQTVRTAQAVFHLLAIDEPQGHLPGFWTTEHGYTRSLYYNGMLESLYTSHDTHARQEPAIRNPEDLRGLPPSNRWYLYRARTQTRNSPTPHMQTAGRHGRTQSSGNPGRGHASRPPLHSPAHTTPQPSYAAATTSGPWESSPGTDIALPQMFARLLAGIEGQRSDTQALSLRLDNERHTQTQINTDVNIQLARINATLHALQSTHEK